MDTIASQISSLTSVYSTVYSGADQRKHQSSASLAFVWGIHRGPVNFPHKGPVTRKMFLFDDVIMNLSHIVWWMIHACIFNSLMLRQNDRHFADDTFRRIFLNENLWTFLKNSLNIVPKVRINNIPALVQIIVWLRPGDKPLSEPMMVSLPTHICIMRPHYFCHIVFKHKFALLVAHCHCVCNSYKILFH